MSQRKNNIPQNRKQRKKTTVLALVADAKKAHDLINCCIDMATSQISHTFGSADLCTKLRIIKSEVALMQATIARLSKIVVQY